MMTPLPAVRERFRRLGTRVVERRDRGMLVASPLFDPDWYAAQYPDVASSGLDPVTHFLRRGAVEGRDPGPYFNSSAYLSRYADVQVAGHNPLVHFLRFGRGEGRVRRASTASPVLHPAGSSAGGSSATVRLDMPRFARQPARSRRRADLVAYTAILGGCDELTDPSVVTPGCRYVCFTDEDLTSDVWEIVRVPRTPDPRRESRRYKLQPHLYFEAGHSLWVDGAFRIDADVGGLVGRYLGRRDLAVFAHPVRDCIFDEAEVCVRHGLDDAERIRAQMQRYRDAGLPEHAGLVTAGVILRRHTPEIAAFNEAWWREVEIGSRRDQLSFDYCAWRLAIPREVIPGDIARSPEFRQIGHVRPPARRPAAGVIDSATIRPA